MRGGVWDTDAISITGSRHDVSNADVPPNTRPQCFPVKILRLLLLPLLPPRSPSLKSAWRGLFPVLLPRWLQHLTQQVLAMFSHRVITSAPAALGQTVGEEGFRQRQGVCARCWPPLAHSEATVALGFWPRHSTVSSCSNDSRQDLQHNSHPISREPGHPSKHITHIKSPRTHLPRAPKAS